MMQFQTQGMTCNHCISSVTSALKGVDSQANVKVDLATQTVDVDSASDPAAMARAMEVAGFPVTAIRAAPDQAS